MKRIIYLFVSVALMVACTSEPHFVVKGNIEGSDSVTFMLLSRESGKIVSLDSAISDKGIFKMSGTIEYPYMVFLIASNTMNRAQFFLENSEITITGKLDSLSDAKISGSKTQDEYQSLIDAKKTLGNKFMSIMDEFQVARQENNSEKVAQLQKELIDLENEINQIDKDFVKNNPSSYVTPSILASMSLGMEANEIEAAINALDISVAKVPVIQELKTKASAMKAVSVGQKAPDFTSNDVNGNPVSLSSKIGTKLLLVDFWAAWCGPCRGENPNVVKVYNEFHKKGFDVFGVSLDREKEEWVKAIADDKLTWTHVSDLQYWNSAAAKLYAVNLIPANFLLDETGTIIARNLRGDDLFNKINEVLGKK
ncbi:MAG: TlpA disulfide reductase family protein [Bacteroidia bacterium]|nr:TlpA disulfide reductase family protein [Bacteroidia bacterium]